MKQRTFCVIKVQNKKSARGLFTAVRPGAEAKSVESCATFHQGDLLLQNKNVLLHCSSCNDPEFSFSPTLHMERKQRIKQFVSFAENM